MRGLSRLALCFALFSIGVASAEAAQASSNAAHAQPAPLTGKADAAANYGKLPLSFEANRGQADPQVRYLSHGGGYALFLTGDEAVLALRKPGKTGGRAQGKAPAFKEDMVRMQLVGANPSPHIAGEQRLPGTANYFIGNDPEKWHTEVPAFAKVRYGNVYPDVDLVYYGNQERLEYDFVVAPGGDPRSILLHFAGGTRLKLSSAGDLQVITADGEITFQKPSVYQQNKEMRVNVPGQFALHGANTVGFKLGAYNRAKPLVIDPVLAYSTYFGGSNGGNYGGDYVAGIAVDSSGNTYITGQADSTDFPVTQGSYQTAKYGSVAFIAKLNPDGTELLYSTYVGGTDGGDYATGIAVDGAGDAYITGATEPEGVFPVTPGAFQTVTGGYEDAFVTKLNPTGTALIYSTYLGGSLPDYGYAIAVNGSGNAYVTGYTDSLNFPVTSGAYQTVNNAPSGDSINAFVTELNDTGTALVYSTYLGGNGGFGGARGDYGAAIALDKSGDAYVAGWTYSTNFPVTEGAFQAVNNAASGEGRNAFVTALNPTGSALLYSTYLGGSNNDNGYGIAVDSSGDAYVTGSTLSDNFPVTQGAFQTTRSPSAIGYPFVTKLNSTGSALVYSTFVGDSDTTLGAVDSGNAIAVDQFGDAFVTGTEVSTGFPVTSDALQATDPGGSNAFVLQLNPSGSALLYSTYFGGSQTDYGKAIAIDATGDVYIAGQTLSSDLPITGGAFQPNDNGSTNGDPNGFVAKLGIGPAPASLISPTPGSTLSGTSSTTFTWTAGTGVTSYALWLGTTGPGSSDLYNSGHISALTAAAGPLPANGATIFATLYSLIDGVWKSNSYTFLESGTPAPATLTSPSAGSILSGTSSTTFTWTAGTGVTSYALWLGSTGPGSSDLYNSGQISTLTATAGPFTANGGTIYASLWSQIDGVWRYVSYTYTASTVTELPQTETTLHNFSGGTGDGANPNGGMVMDSHGDLYGTSTNGGNVGNGYGVLFEISSSGQETVPHVFGAGSDGSSPNGGLVIDAAGNVYGTTQNGGRNGSGAVFKVAPDFTETLLYSFASGSDGRYPRDGLIMDANGNLYGTTYTGGSAGCGTVFEVTPGGAETVLYSFNGGTDGCDPGVADGGTGGRPLAMDANGNLYGTTYEGGEYGYGTVFKLAPNGTETVLHSFNNDGTDGYSPYGGVTIDSQGNLYGVTQSGGTFVYGTIFKVTTGGTESILFSFNSSLSYVQPGLTIDSNQNLYGTLSGGSVFQLAPSGVLTIVYQFSTGPQGNLLLANGNLYGATSSGGTYNDGTVFELSPSASTVAPPVFTPAPGTYNPLQSLAISDTTPGATIYYILGTSASSGGIANSYSGTQYSSSLTLTTTTLVSAVAVAPGGAVSAPVQAIYTIVPPQ